MPKSEMKRWGTLHPFLEGGEVLGRKVANTGFLRALVKADPFDAYHFFLPAPALQDTARQLQALAPGIAGRGGFVLEAREKLPQALSEFTFAAFHLSDFTTDFVPLQRLRNARARNIFPVTGLTHSLSYERFMPDYLRLISPCTSPRDAVVCTSQSAKAMLTATFSRLRSGYGLDEAAFPAPNLPIIPLGVDLAEFPQAADSCRAGALASPPPGGNGQAAAAMRKRLGLSPDDVIFLCLARISPYSKMDILPAIAAFKRAEGLGLNLSTACLVLAGWADEPEMPQVLANFAKLFNVRLIPVTNPTDEERFALYGAADCFLSPSDNLQETFGLTILEAGASGLPVIASAFDGYKDLVLPGKTGVLVPCLGPAETPESNSFAGIWMDNQYHLRLAQQTVVDVPAMAEAVAHLAANPEQRKSMGRAGRHRVEGMFTWDAVIGQYCGLWDFLAEQAIPNEAALRASIHPMQMDFAYSFSGHFSQRLDEEMARNLVVRRTPAGDALYSGQVPPVLYAGMEHMVDTELMRRMLLAARQPVQVASLLEKLSGDGAKKRAAFMVLWALKHDYLEQVRG